METTTGNGGSVPRQPDFPVYVVDDSMEMCLSLEALLTACGYDVAFFTSPFDFLKRRGQLAAGVLLVDLRMDELDGIEVIQQLGSDKDRFPAIMITAHGDIEIAVKAIKHGARDFIQKPFREELLLETIDRVAGGLCASRSSPQAPKDRLSGRERDVAERLVKGLSNKQIAYDLGISVRTVEMHRVRAMQRLGCKSFAELLRALVAK
jgi:two-component system response regulator FixJ